MNSNTSDDLGTSTNSFSAGTYGFELDLCSQGNGTVAVAAVVGQVSIACTQCTQALNTIALHETHLVGLPAMHLKMDIGTFVEPLDSGIYIRLSTLIKFKQNCSLAYATCRGAYWNM